MTAVISYQGEPGAFSSQAALQLPGLPLDLRDEVHVPADARGVALRQALCDFAALGRRREAAA